MCFGLQINSLNAHTEKRRIYASEIQFLILLLDPHRFVLEVWKIFCDRGSRQIYDPFWLSVCNVSLTVAPTVAYERASKWLSTERCSAPLGHPRFLLYVWHPWMYPNTDQLMFGVIKSLGSNLMEIVWERTLKTNAQHILLIEKNEGEENWASSMLNALVIWTFKNTTEERLSTLAAALKCGQVNACIKLHAISEQKLVWILLLMSSHTLTIRVFQEADI